MTIPEALLIMAGAVLIAAVLWALLAARKPTVVEARLTDASYQRWLRACRPPLPWFLALPDATQESMAAHGDAYTTDVCIGIGYAVADPTLAETGAAGGEDAEVAIVQRLAMAAAAKMEQSRGARGTESPPIPAPSESMGGMQWKNSVQRRRVGGKAGPVSFLGKKPTAEGTA